MQYTDEQITDLLDGIYNGSITEYELPSDLYFAIANHLKKGLYKGFGGSLVDFAGSDLELLTELRANIYMFSAAKTYQQVIDIRNMMFDESGNLIGAREFNQIGGKAFDNWNYNWGATEYATAEAQGVAAVKWSEAQRNKDILPNFRYSTIGDACDICAPLDGLVAPIDDPIWESVYPTNHFNCLCVCLQENETVKLTNDDEKNDIFANVTKEMDDVFKMNAGIDKVVFNEDHPYFSVDKKDEDFAKNNFNLLIPQED